MKQIALFLSVLALCGCAGKYDTLFPIKNKVMVHPNHEGVYIVFFNYLKVIEEYGPGVSEVRKKIKESEDLVVWEQTIEQLLPRFLIEENLMPLECDQITVISSSMDEGGGGSATFTCSRHELDRMKGTTSR